MVYISCNVSTLARDLVQLAKVYQVDYLQSVDMFPQTARCEVVVKLTRNKKAPSFTKFVRLGAFN